MSDLSVVLPSLYCVFTCTDPSSSVFFLCLFVDSILLQMEHKRQASVEELQGGQLQELEKKKMDYEKQERRLRNEMVRFQEEANSRKAIKYRLDLFRDLFAVTKTWKKHLGAVKYDEAEQAAKIAHLEELEKSNAADAKAIDAAKRAQGDAARLERRVKELRKEKEAALQARRIDMAKYTELREQLRE